MLCATKRPALSNHSYVGNSDICALTSGSSDSLQAKCCPKLDPEEHNLLMKHNGCFKCRHFDQSHGSHNCPHGFPDGKSYKKITATCDACGNAPKKEKAPHSTKGKAIATIMTDNMTTGSDDDNDFVAAVMPSAVLSNSSFSESNISPPLCSKHFIAKFQIFADHLDFPLTYASLIDNSAHLVLICPEVANELRLQCHPLKKPEIVSVTIKDGKKKKKMTLYHFVKFTVTSMDNIWTSKVIHALVASGLCMPIILGLPFLIHNNIVTNHAECSCVDKKTGYNFLNPALVSPPPPLCMWVKEQIKFMKEAKKEVLTELAKVCHKCIAEKKLTFKEVKDVNVITAIRDTIEIIALKEQLEKHGADIKKIFALYSNLFLMWMTFLETIWLT